jgi:hypothetical protein
MGNEKDDKTSKPNPGLTGTEIKEVPKKKTK